MYSTLLLVSRRFTREFQRFTREFSLFTREFHAFTREFSLFTREFHAFTRESAFTRWTMILTFTSFLLLFSNIKKS
ncbi:hypothetical protein [Peribacillus aracenensis]|uniref:hypothetical protein n=1 Tax=Peribacillus aracenensis TaxID=2976708 RepID=UPI0021A92826|nr:hypothetical protein [Peribacillus sp. BBB004]